MMSGMALPRDTRKHKNGIMSNSMNSIESIYTTSSSKYSTSALHRRKVTTRPIGGPMPQVSDIKKRVMSARMQRVRHLQNQLGDAQTHISELEHENKILKQLYKRQDTALSKYENTNAELPQLLHSHAEEVRVWQTKCKNFQNQNKEMQETIKRKDAIVLSITDQNKHLLHLNKEKNLEERERLAERVKELETRLAEKDNDSKLLARRLQLETKNLKTQLHNEALKYRELSQKMERAYMEIARSKNLIEAYEKKASPQGLVQSTTNLFGLSKAPILKNVRLNQAKLAGQLTAAENTELPTPMQTQAPAFSEMELPTTNNISSSDTIAKPITFETPKPEVEEFRPKTKLSKIPTRVYTDESGSASDSNQPLEVKKSIPRMQPANNANKSEDDDDLESNDSQIEINRDKFRNGLLTLRHNIEGFSYSSSHESDTEQNYDGDDYDDDSDRNTDIMHGDVPHAIPRAELFNHRKHIEEIEQKMNGTSIGDTKVFERKSEIPNDYELMHKDALTSLKKKDTYMDKKELPDLELTQKDMRAGILKKESFLDNHCDDLNRDPFGRQMQITGSSSSISNISNSRVLNKTDTKRPLQSSVIDLKKKSKLLAALKAIDGNDNFEN